MRSNALPLRLQVRVSFNRLTCDCSIARVASRLLLLLENYGRELFKLRAGPKPSTTRRGWCGHWMLHERLTSEPKRVSFQGGFWGVSHTSGSAAYRHQTQVSQKTNEMGDLDSDFQIGRK
jgi:hypothetical protein